MRRVMSPFVHDGDVGSAARSVDGSSVCQLDCGQRAPPFSPTKATQLFDETPSLKFVLQQVSRLAEDVCVLGARMEEFRQWRLESIDAQLERFVARVDATELSVRETQASLHQLCRRVTSPRPASSLVRSLDLPAPRREELAPGAWPDVGSPSRLDAWKDGFAGCSASLALALPLPAIGTPRLCAGQVMQEVGRDLDRRLQSIEDELLSSTGSTRGMFHGPPVKSNISAESTRPDSSPPASPSKSCSESAQRSQLPSSRPRQGSHILGSALTSSTSFPSSAPATRDALSTDTRAISLGVLRDGGRSASASLLRDKECFVDVTPISMRGAYDVGHPTR